MYDRYGDTAGTKGLLLRALNSAMGYRRSNRDILFKATRQQVRRVGEKVPTATRDVVPFQRDEIHLLRFSATISSSANKRISVCITEPTIEEKLYKYSQITSTY